MGKRKAVYEEDGSECVVKVTETTKSLLKGEKRFDMFDISEKKHSALFGARLMRVVVRMK